MTTQRLALIRHPATPCDAVHAIKVEVTWTPPGPVTLRYRVQGDAARLVIPPPSAAVRTDELWRTTCFEAFFRPDAAPSYVEFNFAPSGAWAAYRFDGYREGMAPLETAPPQTSFRVASDGCELTVVLPVPDDISGHLAPSAVIEAQDGRKSYWALEHAGERPDFHNFIGVHLP
jgi:hypothetical protein